VNALDRPGQRDFKTKICSSPTSLCIDFLQPLPSDHKKTTAELFTKNLFVSCDTRKCSDGGKLSEFLHVRFELLFCGSHLSKM
jgi:hypothetical protein